MSHCCEAADSGKSNVLALRVRKSLAWLLPSAVLVLVPQCPACLVAYVGLWTGLGLSLTTVTYLRWAMFVICGACVLYLGARFLSRLGVTGRQFPHFNKESKNGTSNS